MQEQASYAAYKSPISTREIMFLTCLALLPGLVLRIFYQGLHLFYMILTGIITAYFWQILVLILRRRSSEIVSMMTDFTLILTVLILCLSIPSNIPLWLICLGVSVAIVLGREVYGGLGSNIFNPAMLGFAVLLLGFPALMSAAGIDGQTRATILSLSHELRLGGREISLEGITWLSLGQNLAWLAGGIFLLWRRIIDIRIVLAVLLSALLLASVFYFVSPSKYLSPWQHLFAGALIFGAFFVATDPVTAATSPQGRIIYGVIIGFMCICIRNLGTFPDGFAFAVLFANALVVYLDRIRPKYQ